MKATMACARADLLRLRRWPALWVMLGVWMLLDVTFAYVFNYLSYRSGGGTFSTEGISSQALLAGIMPAAAPSAAIQGMPMFGGAILLTLGALAAGSGYAWGAWKTAFTAGPSRLAVTGGTLAALVVVVVGFVLATFVVGLSISLVLATVEGQPIIWPGAGETAQAFGGGVLVLGLWALAGVAIGTLARSPALAVGLGVVWLLAVENLLRGAATLLDWLQPVTDVLPGTAAGSIAGALGATPVSEPGGTPGVVTTLSGGAAVGVVALYCAVCVLATAILVRRRDVT